MLIYTGASDLAEKVVEMVAIQPAAGDEVRLARLEPSDGEALRRFFFRLSPETVYRRFMSPVARPEQTRPERLLDVDHRDREALVGVVDGEIVGVARYARWPGTDAADLAVVVADAWQRQRVATRMLAALADVAVDAGIGQFTLTMQADNRPVLGIVRRLYPSARLALSQGFLEGTVPLPTGHTD